MCPKLLDTIRPGVEVSSRELSDVSADALVLPWRGDVGVLPTLLEEGAPAVLAQLREYPEDRDLRLTSAGMLSVRFLLHLSLPVRGAAGKEAKFLSYLTAIVNGQHSPTAIGARNQRELRTLAETLDAL